jgi:DNA polymerase/3'-5' exonuclease PolX
MAIGTRIPLERAMDIARGLAEQLRPHVVRVKCAGSIRRRRPMVGDIEFVIEPRMIAADLFGNVAPDLLPIRRVAESWGRVKKGGERMIQVELAEYSIDCELYLVHSPAQWGPLLAIRSGPAELAQYAVTRLHDYGRRCEGGRIIDVATGETIPCPTEEDFFRLAGLQLAPPHLRDTAAARWPLEVPA